jgi:small subunit ribosomal protein S14
LAKKSALERWKATPKFKVRFRNRCQICGRPRAFMRRFGMCRICFRTNAAEGRIPGVTKSSW